MRIATWNVERLKHKKELDKILFEIQWAKADILVLTESDEQIHPDYTCYFHTPCWRPQNQQLIDIQKTGFQYIQR